MHDLLQPLIHKAAVHNISVNVARTGLSIGDTAELIPLADGRIGVFARPFRRLFGLIPRRVRLLVGTLGPSATSLIAPAVERGESLRIRIVGLTPEHLAAAPNGPEIHISVWGDPRHLAVWAADGTQTNLPPLKAEGPAQTPA